MSDSSQPALAASIRDLIGNIFDLKQLEASLKFACIDMSKMPLDQLSMQKVDEAYRILDELEKIVESVGGDAESVAKGIQRYFTALPRDYGSDSPPVLKNVNSIQYQKRIVNLILRNTVYTYNMMKTPAGDPDPDFTRYKNLAAEIKVVENTAPIFGLIELYLKNTACCIFFDLAIETIFEISRRGERETFLQQCGRLQNHTLLWHGTRTSNIAGILSRGFSVPPLDVPDNSMLGRAIYFGDISSKSASYCYPSRENPIGFMLLCEVALGQFENCVKPKTSTQLPKGISSRKGVGKSGPDPAESQIIENNVVVPLGKTKATKIDNSDFAYNEFAIYKAEQINIRYLVKPMKTITAPKDDSEACRLVDCDFREGACMNYISSSDFSIYEGPIGNSRSAPAEHRGDEYGSQFNSM